MKKNLLMSLIWIAYSASGQITDYSRYVPLPFPERMSVDHTAKNDHYCIAYDLNTKTEFVTDTNKYADAFGYDHTEPYIPYDLDSGDLGCLQKNMNQLVMVPNPTTFCFSTCVKLFMKFGTSYATASGVLIGSRTVLTAGHCVYDREKKKWADEIEVVPGYNNGNKPFGSANAKTLRTFVGWSTNGSEGWDIGVITLVQSIGNSTGYLGFGYDFDSYFTSNGFASNSFPAESPYTGQFMYKQNGTFDNIYSDIVSFNRDSYGGQSGSGYYDYKGCIYAVLHGSNSNPPLTNCVRITADKFTKIRDWIALGIGNDINKSSEYNFQVFPNPARDKINIQTGEHNKAFTISVTDILGKRMLLTSIGARENSITISIDFLTPGLYSITLHDGIVSKTQRFIKPSME
jgi:V8-like Glu-specific endopeptidase